MNARKEDIEADGFVTVDMSRDHIQRNVYYYERMVNSLADALMRNDFDTIGELIRDAYLRLHGPSD
jgi:hypothetical protein